MTNEQWTEYKTFLTDIAAAETSGRKWHAESHLRGSSETWRYTFMSACGPSAHYEYRVVYDSPPPPPPKPVPREWWVTTYFPNAAGQCGSLYEHPRDYTVLVREILPGEENQQATIERLETELTNRLATIETLQRQIARLRHNTNQQAQQLAIYRAFSKQALGWQPMTEQAIQCLAQVDAVT